MRYTMSMQKALSVNTGIADKFGKPLYIGDIVRYYLSDMRPGGPQLLQIARNKKGAIKLISPGDPNKAGWHLRHTHGQYLTLVDTQYREKDASS